MTRPKVLMYASGWCPYCSRARQLLSTKSVELEEIDVDARAGARTEMIERSGGRHTVPQIFIGEQHIGGCDDLLALDAAGDLDRLLRGESRSA